MAHSTARSGKAPDDKPSYEVETADGGASLMGAYGWAKLKIGGNVSKRAAKGARDPRDRTRRGPRVGRLRGPRARGISRRGPPGRRARPGELRAVHGPGDSARDER